MPESPKQNDQGEASLQIVHSWTTHLGIRPGHDSGSSTLDPEATRRPGRSRRPQRRFPVAITVPLRPTRVAAFTSMVGSPHTGKRSSLSPLPRGPRLLSRSDRSLLFWSNSSRLRRQGLSE